ncbi:MAG: hypothetical protein ACYC6Z_05535 [Thermoleophilia bacterium]
MKVTLEVRNSIGVDVRGESTSSGRIIRIGDPDEGLVTYVILDD